MGSINKTDFSTYSDAERDALAHREAKNESINAYNDKADELKKPDLPPVEATQDTPATDEQIEAEKTEENAGETQGSNAPESEEPKRDIG